MEKLRASLMRPAAVGTARRDLVRLRDPEVGRGRCRLCAGLLGDRGLLPKGAAQSLLLNASGRMPLDLGDQRVAYHHFRHPSRKFQDIVPHPVCR